MNNFFTWQVSKCPSFCILQCGTRGGAQGCVAPPAGRLRVVHASGEFFCCFLYLNAHLFAFCGAGLDPLLGAYEWFTRVVHLFKGHKLKIKRKSDEFLQNIFLARLRGTPYWAPTSGSRECWVFERKESKIKIDQIKIMPNLFSRVFLVMLHGIPCRVPTSGSREWWALHKKAGHMKTLTNLFSRFYSPNFLAARLCGIACCASEFWKGKLKGGVGMYREYHEWLDILQSSFFARLHDTHYKWFTLVVSFKGK